MGPGAGPDMALFKFVEATLKGEPIDVYGHGQMQRDFTYIDDLVEAIVRLIDCAAARGRAGRRHDSLSPGAPYRVVNIGGGQPVGLLDFIDAVEAALGDADRTPLAPMQKGDVPATWASPDLLRALTGYVPSTAIETGVQKFIEWHRQRYAAGAPR